MVKVRVGIPLDLRYSTRSPLSEASPSPPVAHLRPIVVTHSILTYVSTFNRRRRLCQSLFYSTSSSLVGWLNSFVCLSLPFPH